jgi:hypothetical protein
MKRCWIVLVLAACGGGQGGGGAGAAADRSLTQTCAKAFACEASFPADSGFEFEGLFGISEAECQANFRQVFDPAEIQASVDAGRVIFDAGDADVCLDAAAALTCDEFWGNFTGDNPTPQPAECDTAFIGTVEDGGTCSIDLDCVNDTCDDSTMTCVNT